LYAVLLHEKHASFDKLRMRGSFSGTKKDPHPELVEGRTLLILGAGPNARVWMDAGSGR
jgi:hypothetical protein